MVFKKGHKLNLGNQYAKGMKHTSEWKEAAKFRMLGNMQGFKKGMKAPMEGRIFSEEHRRNLSIAHRGKFLRENHPRWLVDRTLLKDDHKDRGGQLHREWSKQVKGRDGWKCRIANDDCEGRIVAHHVLTWRDYPELRYVLNNGLALCERHHPRKRVDEIKLAPLFKNLIDLNIPHLEIENVKLNY